MTMKSGNYILARKGSFFYTYKAIIFKYSANPSRIRIRTEETMSGKVNLHIYASADSSKTHFEIGS